MCKYKRDLTVFMTLLLTILLLAACAPVAVPDAATINHLRQQIVTQMAAHQQAQHTTPATNAALASKTVKNSPVATQQIALFAIEPIASPCCGSAPTAETALEAAKGVSGVLVAELNGDATVRVQFDPTQTNPRVIASAINQATFLVTVQESDANAKSVVTNANGADNQ